MGGRNDYYFGSDELVHPDAPDGGTGRGYSYSVQNARGYREDNAPHPSSPAARTWDWGSFGDFDLLQRVGLVHEALEIGQRLAPSAILEETGEELSDILHGLIPGLVLCLCVVAATTFLGGAAGAALGAFALGWGAIPTGLFGAELGAEAGLLLLQGLGLAALYGVVGVHFWRSLELTADGVSEAWHAADHPQDRGARVYHAGETIAKAYGVFMRGILQGIVALLLSAGAKAAASRVPAIVAELRRSRLGEEFAGWIERHWERLIKNPRLREDPLETTDGEGAGGGSQSNEKSNPPSKPEPEPKSQKPSETDEAQSAEPARKYKRIDGANDNEDKIDAYMQDRGHDVKPNPAEGQQGAGRQGDRYVDGVKTEYKTIDDVQTTDENHLSAAVSNRSMEARGQASNVVIDTRNQDGMNQAAAERGVRRAYGADSKAAGGAKLQNIRVIGKDFDISVPRKP